MTNYHKKEFLQKIITCVLLLVYIVSICSNVFAIGIANDGLAIQYIYDGGGEYLQFSVKKAADGRYAYCLEHKKSVPTGQDYYTSGEMGKGLTYILQNGFPNVSFTGDNNKDYYITQAAVHYYLGEVQWITIPGMNDPSGLLPHIMNLVNGARNAESSNFNNTSIDLSEKNAKFVLNNNYYETPEISCTYVGNLTGYTVSLENAPSGMEIVSLSGNVTNSFSAGEKFKLRIATSNVKADYSVKVNVTGNFNVKTSMLYVTTNQNYQSMAMLEAKTVVTKNLASLVANLDPVGSIKIIKKDKQTGKLINGTTFNITNNNGYNSTINVNGEITISNLKLGNYVITEVQANPNYVIDKTPIQVTVEAAKVKTVNFENIYKTGKLKIVKLDKDKNTVKLEGVKFELYNFNDIKVGTYTTNKDGEILVENLNIGNYKWKEITPKAGYVLDSTEISALVEYNKTNSITLTNEKEKGQIRIVKQDKDNNSIKLEGVTFEVLDNNKNVIQTLTTNSKRRSNFC